MPYRTSTSTESGFGRPAEGRIAAVGANLGATLRSVLAAVPDAPTRAVELSAFLKIDKTLAVRLIGAIKKQDPLAICHGMPGPRGVRAALSAAASKGASRELIDEAESAIKDFEELVHELGGSRTAFNTVIGGLLPDVRERIERANKKAAFDAMCNLLGHQVDTSFITCIIQPSADGGDCDTACFNGKVGWRHLTPRVARMIWAQRCTAPSVDGRPVSYNLDRKPVSSDADVPILHEFSTQPVPDFKLYRYGETVYVALAGDETPEPEPADLFIGSYTPHSFLLHRTPETAEEFVSFTPSEPARVAFMDVFVHEDVWPNASPRLELFRTGPRGNLNEPHERPFDRIDLLETVRMMGKGTDRIHTNDVENYAAMVRTVFERVGWDSDRFRAYRVRIEYPLINAQIMLSFPLPDPPQ